MCLNEKPSTPANKTPLRLFVLITTRKQADIATKVFHECGIPSHNRLHASGTAPNDIMDMLGLGNTDKILLFTMMPKTFADMMLRFIKNTIRIVEKVYRYRKFFKRFKDINIISCLEKRDLLR